MGSDPIFLRVALPFLAGYFVSYVYRMVNAVLAPTLAAEFGLSAGGLGLLSSMYFLSFALCQLPMGLAMDRFGPRRVNAVLLLVAAAGGAWFAHAESAAGAMAARALIGVGVSVALMSSLTAFVLWYPVDRLSTMNAIAFSVGMVGAMTSFAINMGTRIGMGMASYGTFIYLVARITVRFGVANIRSMLMYGQLYSTRLIQLTNGMYPKLVGKFQNHHVIPSYIARALGLGTYEVMVRIPAPLHAYLHRIIQLTFPNKDALRNIPQIRRTLHELVRAYERALFP